MIEIDKKTFVKKIVFEKGGEEISMIITLKNIKDKHEVIDFLDSMLKEIKESI